MSSLHKLKPGCWICKILREPAHLIFFESRTSVGKLNPDQFFKGYSFVTLKYHEEELYQLTDENRKSFLEDMSRVATALAKTFNPDKMNYELLVMECLTFTGIWFLATRQTRCGDAQYGQGLYAERDWRGKSTIVL